MERKVKYKSLGIIFCNNISIGNLQGRRSHLEKKNLPKSVNRSKYKTLSTQVLLSRYYQ